MIKRLTVLLCLIAAPCAAQIVGTASQPLTTTANVATIPMAGVPSVSITVSGTWTGTLSFQFVTPPSTACTGTLSTVDVAPIVAGARVTTTSANGTWVLDNAGFLTACVYASAISSGTATVTAVRGFRSPASVITIGDAPSSANRVPTLSDINNGGSVTARNNTIVEGGKAADDDASALFPLLIGGYASTAVPTAMSADGDAVKSWCTRNGACHILNTAGTGGTPASTSDSATNVTLLAANTSRLGARCTNTSTAALYLKFGATATTSSFSVIIPAGGYYNFEQPIYTGIVDGIWATDPNTGAAICQELTQ